MPIYEYICDDCGTKFEKLVRATEDASPAPDCGESHLKTALSTFAAHSSNGKASRAKPVPLVRRRNVSDAGSLRTELAASPERLRTLKTFG
jgi:putative FmdB family regulatory protein